MDRIDALDSRIRSWFCAAQNADGSWGGAKGIVGSTEETALAVEALAGIEDSKAREAVQRGAQWLMVFRRAAASTLPMN